MKKTKFQSGRHGVARRRGLDPAVRRRRASIERDGRQLESDPVQRRVRLRPRRPHRENDHRRHAQNRRTAHPGHSTTRSPPTQKSAKRPGTAPHPALLPEGEKEPWRAVNARSTTPRPSPRSRRRAPDPASSISGRGTRPASGRRSAEPQAGFARLSRIAGGAGPFQGPELNDEEREGFEPSVPFGTHDFQSCAFDHSAISPLPAAKEERRGHGARGRAPLEI
jgi:hypothetical protein